MVNNRIFYAVHAVGIAGHGATTRTYVHGVQSVGMNVTFNLEPVFELGLLPAYEDIENIPDVEVTLEKVLDGHAPLYMLATQDASTSTFVGRSSAKCMITLGIWDDTLESASGNPLVEVDMSGMLVSSVSYSFPADGNFTESVSFIGQHRNWSNTTKLANANTGTDAPITASGGVNRREDLMYGTGNTVIPSAGGGGIPGVPANGVPGTNSEGFYDIHVSSISVNADYQREALVHLGNKTPYFRYPNFPSEVTCDIEVISTSGDFVNVDETSSNITNKTIKIKAREGTYIDLGTQNKLTSISYSGGDTGGGTVAVTYSYRNFNTMTVTHPDDPGPS